MCVQVEDLLRRLEELHSSAAINGLEDFRSKSKSLIEEVRRQWSGRDEVLLETHSIAKLDTTPETQALVRDPYATIESSAAVNSANPVELATSRYRFEKVNKHKAGGLGVIYVANDLELNRSVALKQMKSNQPREVHNRARFMREAEITGGLQHPGIVPIYSLGTYEDGAPFYAMRFIEGQTLAEVIKEFHGNTNFTEAERSIEFRKLLSRFVGVCQALAYAHSKSILHRDLKPDNIMLGDFGETLVVDWGLAKRQQDQEVAPNSDTERVRGANNDGLSNDDDVMGTPSYMPPEQARGEFASLGPAADIYSLGATLYSILTDKPPFLGKDPYEVLDKVIEGKLLGPRELDSRIPKALEAICLKAMAKLPEERYGSARLLAEDIEKYLADESVSAYRETVYERSRRWMRKHPAMVTSTSVALVFGIIASAVFGGYANHKERQLAKKNQELAATLVIVGERTKLALDTYNHMVFGVQEKLTSRPGTLELRKELLESAKTGLKKILDEARKQGLPDSTLVWSHLRNGDVELLLGNSRAAHNEVLQGLKLAEQLVAADPLNAKLRRDLSVAYSGLGDVTQKLSKLEEALDCYQKSTEIREQLAERDSLNSELQRDLCFGYGRLGDVWTRLGEPRRARDFYKKELSICSRLAESEPQSFDYQRSLSICYDRLADVDVMLGQISDANSWCNKALDIRKTIAESNQTNMRAQRDLSSSYCNLGDLELRQGRTKEAFASYEKSATIRRQQSELDPQNTEVSRDLGAILMKRGDVSQQLGQVSTALVHYKEALAVRKRLAELDSQNSEHQGALGESTSKLADVLMMMGQTQDARIAYDSALEISKRLAEEDPQNFDKQRSLGICHSKRGDFLLQLGNPGDAIDAYQFASFIFETLAHTEPKNVRAQSDLSVSYSNLGDAMLETGSIDKAIDAHKKATDVFERIVKLDSGNAGAQRNLCVCNFRLGEVLLRKGERSAAQLLFEKVSQGFQRLVDADPNNVQAHRDLGASFLKLANFKRESGHLQEAFDYYHKSLNIDERLAKGSPESMDSQMDLFVSYFNLGEFQKAQCEYPKAQEFFEKARDVALPWHLKQALTGEFSDAVEKAGGRIEHCRTAQKVIADLEFAFTQNPEQIPELLAIRVRSLLHRQLLAEALETAERFSKWAEEQEKNGDDQLYNAACAFAICAAAANETQRDAILSKSIALLVKIKSSGYFTPESITHFKQDADFIGVRMHAKFIAFLNQLEAKSSPSDSNFPSPPMVPPKSPDEPTPIDSPK